MLVVLAQGKADERDERLVQYEIEACDSLYELSEKLVELHEAGYAIKEGDVLYSFERLASSVRSLMGLNDQNKAAWAHCFESLFPESLGFKEKLFDLCEE